MAGDNLVVSGIELDARETLREIRRLDRRMRELEGQVDDVTRSTSRADRGLKSFGRTVAGAAAAFGAFQAAERAAGFIFKVNREFQQFEARLTSVTGSAEEADEAFQLITDFAQETPFQIQNLVQGFTDLRVRGIQPTVGMMRDLGNFAAAFGRDFTDVINALTRAAQGGTERLREGFGIPIRKMGDELEVTFQGTTHTVEATADALIGLFRQISRENFPQAMSRQMDTLVGSISNLEDTASVAANRVGEEGLNQAIQDLATTIDEAIAQNDEFARQLGQQLAAGVRVSTDALELFLEHSEAIIDAVQTLAVAGISRNLIPAVTRAAGTFRTAAASAGIFQGAITALSAGMGALGGPAGIAITATFALAQFATRSEETSREVKNLRDRTDELRQSMEDLTEAEIENKIADISTAITERSQREIQLRGRQGELETQVQAMAGTPGLPASATPEMQELQDVNRELRKEQRAIDELHDQLGLLGDLRAQLTEGTDEQTDSTRRQVEATEKLIDRLREERDELKFSEAQIVLRSEAFKEATQAEKAQIVTLLEHIESLELQAEAEEEAREAAEKRLETLKEQRQEVQRSIEQNEEQARQHVDQLVRDVRRSELESEMRRLEQASQAFSQAITDPLENIVTGAQNVEEAFRSMVQGILREAARLTAQEFIGDTLSNFITGLAGGGIPDAPDTSGIHEGIEPPSFQHGGAFEVAGSGGVDSSLVAFRATPGERVSVDRPGRSRGGGTTNVNSKVELQVVANDTRGFDQLLESRRDLIVGLVRQGINEGV